MTEISIMTNLEHERAILHLHNLGIDSTIVYGISDSIGNFAIGSGIKDAERAINVLSHESIHDILKVLFTNINMSLCLDRDLIYNVDGIVKRGYSKGLTVREAILELFTIEEQTFI